MSGFRKMLVGRNDFLQAMPVPFWGLEDPEIQYTAAQKVFDEKLSVRETEKTGKAAAESKAACTESDKQPGGGSLSAAGRKAEGNCGNEGFHPAQ